MRPDKFNGTGSVDTFLAQFDICCSYNSWNDRDKAAHLKCCLTGVAGQLLWDTEHPDELTYYELREKLRRRFGSDDQQEKIKQNFVLVVGAEEKHWPSCTKTLGR